MFCDLGIVLFFGSVFVFTERNQSIIYVPIMYVVRQPHSSDIILATQLKINSMSEPRLHVCVCAQVIKERVHLKKC